MNKLYDKISKLENTVCNQVYAICLISMVCIFSICLNISYAIEKNIYNTIIDDYIITIETLQTETMLCNENDSEEIPIENDDENIEEVVSEPISISNDIQTLIPTHTSILSSRGLSHDLAEKRFDVVENEIEEIPTEPNPTPVEDIITDEFANDILFPETELTGNEELDISAFRKTIEEIAPNLVGIEGALFENYEKYGIKPSFPLAVACLESGYGKSRLAQYKNNLHGMNAYPANGMSAYEHAFTYESKSESVLDFGDRIYNKYISQGLTTLEGINAKYCPPNPSWSSHVRSIKNKIENTYKKYIS